LIVSLLSDGIVPVCPRKSKSVTTGAITTGRLIHRSMRRACAKRFNRADPARRSAQLATVQIVQRAGLAKRSHNASGLALGVRSGSFTSDSAMSTLGPLFPPKAAAKRTWWHGCLVPWD